MISKLATIPIDPLAESSEDLDPEKIISDILGIVKKEVSELKKKSNAGSLGVQDARLLDSYLGAVITADEQLKLNKKKITEREIKEMTDSEIKTLLKD